MYVQVHENNDVTNTALSRTTDAIALRPFNEHGGWAFMSLVSGNQVVRFRWTILPIPNDVVTRVHELAASQNDSPNEINADTPFTWISGEPIIASDVVDEGASEAEIGEHEDQNNDNNEQEMHIAEEQIENNDNNNNLDLNQERDGVVTDDEYEEEESNENNEMSTEITNQRIADEECKDANERSVEENEECKHADERSVEEDFQQLFNSNNDANEKEASDDEENVNNEDERSDNNDVDTPGVAFDPVVIEDKDDAKTIQKEKLRYNPRKRIKDVREQTFNKRHYNFLNIYRNKTMRYSKRTRTYEDYSQGVCNALVRIQNNEAYNQSALNRDLIGCCMT